MADFIKYQALGNDYLLIDPQLVECAQDAQTVRALCDRHFGLGADGVLFGPAQPPGAPGPVTLTIFNSDGSACERSANGIRMFALYLAQRYGAAAECTVRTVAGDSAVRVCDARSGLVRIGMGRPSFDPRDIPVTGIDEALLRWSLAVGSEQLQVTSVNNGNPHTVAVVDALDARRTAALGPLIAGHARFPHRSNVEFVQVVSRDTIDAQIWERGAGSTLASGSGGCAAAAAARALGLVDDQVTVRMPGGSVDVAVDGDAALWLTGVVEQVATGDLSPTLRARLGVWPRRAPAPPEDFLAGKATS
jgi:diaminopimelate epimerase